MYLRAAYYYIVAVNKTRGKLQSRVYDDIMYSCIDAYEPTFSFRSHRGCSGCTYFYFSLFILHLLAVIAESVVLQ